MIVSQAVYQWHGVVVVLWWKYDEMKPRWEERTYLDTCKGLDQLPENYRAFWNASGR
jgi:hypothetical protein